MGKRRVYFCVLIYKSLDPVLKEKLNPYPHKMFLKILVTLS